jgi:uncharacterized protein YlxW (UPF0749 family)
VDFIVDNAVGLSAIALGVLVLAGLAIAGIAGLRLWRAVRSAQRRATAAAAELAAETDRLSASLAQLPERQAELQASITALQRRAAAAALLARSASEALAVLRAPLRYLGR